MADVLTPEQRSLNMSRVRGKDTKPEMLLRKGLHARGFRFRLHRRDLPGRPDLVFPKYRAVVFVHGCFWHGHDCPLFKRPATNAEFWERKVERNRANDAAALDALQRRGWRVTVVWECTLRGKDHPPLDDVLASIATWFNGQEETGCIAGVTARGNGSGCPRPSCLQK